MDKNERDVLFSQEKTEKLKELCKLIRYFITTVGIVAGLWILVIILQIFRDRSDDFIIKLLEGLKPYFGITSWFIWIFIVIIFVIIYLIERRGKARAINLKGKYQEKYEKLEDKKRTSSNLDRYNKSNTKKK